jgi:RNA polymerase sigma-70 factor (ECF subfamily)
MSPPPDHLDALLHDAFRYAMALTHEPGAAEDLVQEACVSVIRARGPWARGYLFRAVRSRWLDRGRRESAPHFARTTTNGFVEPPTREPPHLSREEMADAGVTLDKALGRLNVAEREAIGLSVVCGLTARQIGRHMDRPRGSVLSLMQRGREKLSQLMSRSTLEVSP